MKRIYLLATVGIMLLTACNNHASTSHDEHNHATHAHGAHDGHNHDEHNHNGHNHNGHNHNHNAHDEHNHDGHNHAPAAEANPMYAHSENSDAIIIEPAKAKHLGIVSKKIALRPFRKSIPASGRIEAAQGSEHTIVATTAGVVNFARTLVEGQHVNKGELVLNISANHLQEGDPVVRARIAYETATADYERIARLLENRLATQAEYNAAKERYETTRIAYESLAKQHNTNGTGIHAQQGGYIKNCLVSEGDYVSMGQPLIITTSQNRLYLHAEVAQRYFAELHNIETANFRTSFGNNYYQLANMGGKLLSYGKSVGANSHFVTMTFSFEGRSDLMPGSSVEIYLLGRQQEGTIVLPKSALIEEQGNYFVYVQLCPESYSKQEVKLGMTNGNDIEIISGLTAGQAVVTQGAYHVKLASTSNALPAHNHEH